MEKKDRRHQKANAFILCILSHGDKGSIYGIDREPILIDDIMAKFDGENCNALSGKPKAFIIQACQGGKS